MDGTLGKRALGLLQAMMGRRDADRSASGPDIVDQVVDRVGVNGAASSAPAGTNGVADLGASEAARREIESALAWIFTSAADAIVTIDQNQRILMFNHAAEQLF